MSYRFPNCTAQLGAYSSVDIASVTLQDETTIPGHISFAEAAAAEGWVDGDQVVVRIEASTGFKIWTASWGASPPKLTRINEELTKGAIGHNAEVKVNCCVTKSLLDNAYVSSLTSPVEMVATPENNFEITLLPEHNGKMLRILAQSGAPATITVKLDDLNSTIPIKFHCMLVQECVQAVRLYATPNDGFITNGFDVNGGSLPITMRGPWTSGYVYKTTDSNWVALV